MGAVGTGIALSLMMKIKLPELIVSYEDVAELIMRNLQSGGDYGRRRVGVALPEGERAGKPGWALGERGPRASVEVLDHLASLPGLSPASHRPQGR